LFYFLPMSDQAVGVAKVLALLLCAWSLKLLLRWEWLFSRRSGGKKWLEFLSLVMSGEDERGVWWLAGLFFDRG